MTECNTVEDAAWEALLRVQKRLDEDGLQGLRYVSLREVAPLLRPASRRAETSTVDYVAVDALSGDAQGGGRAPKCPAPRGCRGTPPSSFSTSVVSSPEAPT